MTTLFEPQRSAERRDRAALIKARLSFADVLLALGREEEAANCVCCGVIGDVSYGDDAWRCQSCGRGGDIIDFVRIVKDCGFREACDFLETITGKHRCSKTGEFFGEDLRGGSARQSARAAAGGRSPLPRGAGRADRGRR